MIFRLRRLLIGLTHRLWNTEISRLLCAAYREGVIDSRQLHDLTSRFDPTQRHCRVNEP